MTITETRANGMFRVLIDHAYAQTDEWYEQKSEREYSKRDYIHSFRLTLCENGLISNATADIIHNFYLNENIRNRQRKYPRAYELLHGDI